MSGKGWIGGPDPYGQVLSTFVAGGNRINDYDIASASPSRYAPPLALRLQMQTGPKLKRSSSGAYFLMVSLKKLMAELTDKLPRAYFVDGFA